MWLKPIDPGSVIFFSLKLIRQCKEPLNKNLHFANKIAWKALNQSESKCKLTVITVCHITQIYYSDSHLKQ